MIEIYTDGSSRLVEKAGGFGVVVTMRGINDVPVVVHLHQEQKENVTNNQMELAAIIYACEYADEMFPDDEVLIYSDSQYCVKAINEWMYTWSKNGWINSKKEPVKNLEQMQKLHKLFSQDFYHCAIMWRRGHNGDPGNELADALATHDKKKFSEIALEGKIKVLASKD